MRKTSYDERIVVYEDIHEIRAEDMEAFVRAGAPRDGDRILDFGCGYGAVTCALIKELRARENPPERVYVDLVDESEVQLDRAKKTLDGVTGGTVPRVHPWFQSATVPNDVPEWFERYDVIYAKQVIHETREEEQPALVAALFRALRPGGRLVVWEIALDDNPKVAEFFRKVIRKKDKAAGYSTLISNRHFLQRWKLLQLLQEGGGVAPSVVATVPYRFRSKRRLDAELGGRMDDLLDWNEEIVGEHRMLDADAQAEIKIDRTEPGPDGTPMSVEFTVPVVIAGAVKLDDRTRNTLGLLGAARFQDVDDRKLPSQIISAAISSPGGADIAARLGPALLRFSIVEWTQRYAALRALGADYLLRWHDDPKRITRAYAAYLTGLAADGGWSERSLRGSATGFVADLFTDCGDAGVAHFELEGDRLRYIAQSVHAEVQRERILRLPDGWRDTLAEYEAPFDQDPGLLKSRNITDWCAQLYGEKTPGQEAFLDELAQELTTSRDGGQAFSAATPTAVRYVALGVTVHNSGAPPELDPRTVLRLASYMHRSGCHHVYYLMPPSLLFEVPPDGDLEDGEESAGSISAVPIISAMYAPRFEQGNLHVSAPDALPPSVVLELLHWQSAIWHRLTAVEAKRNLSRPSSPYAFR